jgi:N-acetylmuramoyl-L-alanine amidase
MMSPIDNYFICTVVGEARGEPIEGQVGVANVIKNRAYASNRSYQDVCLAPKQFSCWNPGDPNFKVLQNLLSNLQYGNPISEPEYRQCIAVVRAVQEGDFLDNTNGCKNYVTLNRYEMAKLRNDPSKDHWILSLKKEIILGSQVFLK